MPRQPLGERAMTDAERQRKRRERLRQERPTPPNPLHAAQREIERLRQRVHELERRLAAKPAPAKPRPPIDEPAAIARLKQTIRMLRAELSHVRAFHEKEQDRRGIMSFATYTTVMKCLHPDQPTPTPAQRQEACGLFSQWRQANGKQPKR